MQYLTVDEVILIHKDMIRSYGGAALVVRDPGLLDSALAMAQQAVFGAELYPTVAATAAILLFLLVQNHPFVDGNKRTAPIATLRFVEKNDCKLEMPQEEAFDIPVAVADGKMSQEELTSGLATRIEHMDPSSPGDAAHGHD